MANSKKSLGALVRALEKRVQIDEKACYAASFDSMKYSFMPEAVVTPRKEAEVGKVLELANTYGVPVTPRGAGTSRTASATPIEGGWVLDLSKLDKIVIHSMQGQAQVQAGAVTAAVQQRAEEAGWFYPPDPSSKKYSTIGGNIACNAGGLRGAKYGVTRDYVVALRGYLPTGEGVEWGTATRKNATGYNMRDLWIGSEGTLGVVTGATLKLVPKPETRWTVLLAFPDEATALTAVEVLLESKVLPSICEFLDRNAVKGAEAFTGKPVFKGMPERAVILLELDGPAVLVREEKKRVLEWAKRWAEAFKPSRNEAEAEALWAVRRACSPAMFRLADSKLNEDVVVPLDKQVKLMQEARKLENRYKLPVAVFGHAGDGNLHVNIMYRREEPREVKRAHQAVEALMKAVVRLGGAMSGEHGIGLAKSPFLSLQFSPVEIQAMKAIKDALDPIGILNGRKIFERTPLWELRPVEHQFPWDRS